MPRKPGTPPSPPGPAIEEASRTGVPRQLLNGCRVHLDRIHSGANTERRHVHRVRIKASPRWAGEHFRLIVAPRLDGRACDESDNALDGESKASRCRRERCRTTARRPGSSAARPWRRPLGSRLLPPWALVGPRCRDWRRVFASRSGWGRARVADRRAAAQSAAQYRARKAVLGPVGRCRPRRQGVLVLAPIRATLAQRSGRSTKPPRATWRFVDLARRRRKVAPRALGARPKSASVELELAWKQHALPNTGLAVLNHAASLAALRCGLGLQDEAQFDRMARRSSSVGPRRPGDRVIFSGDERPHPRNAYGAIRRTAAGPVRPGCLC